MPSFVDIANPTRNAKLGTKVAVAGLSAEGATLASQLKAVRQPKPVELQKKATNPKAIESLKWPAAELAGLEKEKRKANKESSLFKLMIMVKQSTQPPFDLYAFKYAALVAHLKKVAILPEYYDFCNKLDTTSRRERLTRARY